MRFFTVEDYKMQRKKEKNRNSGKEKILKIEDSKVQRRREILKNIYYTT